MKRHGKHGALLVAAALLLGGLVLGGPGLTAQRARGGGPAQAWKLLREKYDHNHDGRITPAEYPREASKFEAFDRDGDGVLTRRDFTGGGRGPARRSRGGSVRLAGMVVAAADANGNREVSGAEWKAFVQSVRRGDRDAVSRDKVVGAVTHDVRGARRRMRARMVVRALDRDGDGVIRTADLDRAFARLDRDRDGTIAKTEFPGRARRSARPPASELPQCGDVAPDFELPHVNKPEKTVRLSSFAGAKPVALLFGSYT